MSTFLQHIDKTPASIKVVEQFRNAMKNGELKIGDKLPSERILAEQLGISRPPLREGLRILAAYGIVEIRAGEGTFIIDKFAEQVFDFLGIGAMDNMDNIAHLLQFRKVIEKGSVDIFIEQADERMIDEMLLSIEQMSNAESMEDRVKGDADFHNQLIALTGNKIIIEMYKMTNNMLRTLIGNYISHDHVLEEALNDHKAIYEALKTRNADLCKNAIDTHITHITSYGEKYLK